MSSIGMSGMHEVNPMLEGFPISWTRNKFMGFAGFLREVQELSTSLDVASGI